MTGLAYPLSWPAGWKRHKRRDRARFGNTSSCAQAREVLHELSLLGVRESDVVISTNVQVRLDGLPRANQRQPEDPGAAVYFKLNGEDRVLACDRWDRVEHNLRAIEKHIDALRGQARWGVGSVNQAFAGYKALPEAASGKSWWQILGLEEQPTTRDEVEAARRQRAKRVHPDVAGGSAEAFRELQVAYETGLSSVGGA